MTEETKKTDNSTDLNHFDTNKYSEFIKTNISSVLNETYNNTFQKIIELNTTSILNQIHQKMSNYIYEQKPITEIDVESEEYKIFTKNFETKLNENINGCWCGNDRESELKRCNKNIIVRTINTYIEKYKLIYIKHLDLPYRSSNSNISKDIYIYVFTNKIIVFQFRMENYSNRTEQYITMFSYSYNFIPQFVIDIFNLVQGVNRDSQGYPIDEQILTPQGFDIFMTHIDSLLKKFENPFYFVSGNSRFYNDIVQQKIEYEKKIEEFEVEKERFNKVKKDLESSFELENKLEELKKENIKRIKILKKIKEEKALFEEERKRLEEIKHWLNETSDIDIGDLV